MAAFIVIGPVVRVPGNRHMVSDAVKCTLDSLRPLATTSRFHASTSDLIEARCFSIEAALSLMNLAVEHA